MTKDKYLLYGLAIVVGSALAIWVGVPPINVLFLACPAMMFFHDERDEQLQSTRRRSSHGEDVNSPHAVEPGHTDGPRDRIDRP